MFILRLICINGEVPSSIRNPLPSDNNLLEAVPNFTQTYRPTSQ